MKMPKMKFDTERVQLFLFHHVEKLVLGLVVCVMGLLIWQGLRLEGLEKSKTPQGLLQKSDEMLAFIDAPTRWNEVGKERVDQVPMNIAQLVETGQKPTDALAYTLPVSINRPSFPKHNPRTDPELLPPEHVIVVPVVGPLAVFAKQTDVDPLYERPAADLEPPVIVKPKPKAKPKNKPGYGPGGEAAYGSPDGGSAMPGMPGPGGSTKKKKSRNNRYEDSALAGDSYMPQPGMGSGYGYGMGATPETIYPESVNEGFMLQNAEITIAKPVYAMTVMAVVPILKQTEKFEKAFAESLDFDSNRDLPWYVKFEVQRADVTADPTGPIDWSQAVLIDPNKVQVQQLGRPADMNRPEIPPEWAGVVPEVVDLNYIDPKLTHPAPPVLHRDLWPFLTHPDVPLATAMQMSGEYGTGVPGAPGATTGDDSGDLFGNPNAPPGSGMSPGMPGMPMPGMPGGARGSPDGGYGGGFRGGGEAAYGVGRGSAMMGMGSYGGGYSRPGYGDGGGYNQPGMTYTPPKYKLIRITDTQVQPRRMYSYRVRVWLHDPNHPFTNLYLAPSVASLDDKVKQRIKSVDEEVKAGKRRPLEANVVMTDWSAPSAPAELPSPNRFFAVSITEPKEQLLVKDRPMVPTDQPKAEMLVVKFDLKKAADVGAEQTVHLGSSLNLVPDPKADPAIDPKAVVHKCLHPVTKQIVELPKYGFVTGAVVADIQGGEKIVPSLDKNNPNTLQAPGEMLVIDATGRLHVLNEVEDIEGVRRFGFPKPPPMPASGELGPAGEAGYDPLLGSPDGGRGSRRQRGS